MVIHTAAPIQNSNSTKPGGELISESIDGTMNVLNAARKFNVKRVVCTSSYVTVNNHEENKEVLDHTDIADPAMIVVVNDRLKIHAEKVAREFINQIKSESSLELVTLHPGFIIGPTLTTNSESHSLSFIQKLATGALPKIPLVSMPLCDVRDVSECHVEALSSPAFNRYIVCGNSHFFHELSKWIKEDFGQKGLTP